jgi:hypothetical protein
MPCFVVTDKMILKFAWNCNKLRIVNIILKMKKIGLTFPDVKTYCKPGMVVQSCNPSTQKAKVEGA